MKLTMRATATLGKKVTLITAAFVLAVSTLTAATPFVLSQNASALEVTGNVARINNAADLAEAVNNPAVTNLSIKSSFTTSDKTVLSGRNMNIDGNGNTITFTNTPNWNGEYVFQAYNITLSVKNIKITGGDAAIYANGSTVNLQGSVDVSGNEFGGIEVSQGTGVTLPAKLNVQGTVTNSSEQTAKPTAWTDDASTANATVTGPFTKTTHIGGDQYQYYLNPSAANIAATNSTTQETFATIQDAINDTNTVAGNTIVLNKDVTLGTLSVRVTKSLTIDGMGKTVATTFNRGAGGVSNAAFVILAPDTTLKNVTVQGNGNGTSASHGIVVQDVTGVTLQGVTAKNNAAGVIVNGSAVTIDGITTTGNNWYGVNVDKPGAKLTIKGANSHTEAAALYADNKTVGLVDDQAAQYTTVDNVKQAGDRAYMLKSSAPVATITAPEFATGSVAVEGSATSSFGIKSHWFEITNPDNSLSYAYQMNAMSDTFSFNLDTSKGNGVYKVRYVVADKRGVRNDVNGATVKTITVDSEKPALAITNPANQATQGRNFTVQGTASDATAGIENVRYNVRNLSGFGGTTSGAAVVPMTDATYNAAAGTWSFDLTGLNEGYYRIAVQANDNSGNFRARNIEVYVDATAPTVTITSPASDFATENPQLSGTIDGDATEVQIRILDAENNVVETGSATINGSTWTYDVTNDLNDGDYTVEATAKDASGNEGTATPVAFTVDTTTPTTPTNPGGNGNEAPAETDGGEEPVPAEAAADPELPSGAGNIAAILGNNTTIPDADETDSSAQNGAEVEGASSENKAAQAAADANKGVAMGLAWYWWLLILAGIALILWWIIAAIRRRQSQDA